MEYRRDYRISYLPHTWHAVALINPTVYSVQLYARASAIQNTHGLHNMGTIRHNGVSLYCNRNGIHYNSYGLRFLKLVRQ